VLKALLDHGADLNVKDKGGATALAFAVRASDIDVVRFLVERGLDPKGLTPGTRRAAFARYDLPTTEYLMSKGMSGIPDVLITAAAWQPSPLIARWLESGADVNASNPAQYGRTPLLTAVTSEGASPETLKLLLDHGADPNARMTEGESPLDWAIYKGDQRKIQILEQYPRDARQWSPAGGNSSCGKKRGGPGPTSVIDSERCAASRCRSGVP